MRREVKQHAKSRGRWITDSSLPQHPYFPLLEGKGISGMVEKGYFARVTVIVRSLDLHCGKVSGFFSFSVRALFISIAWVVTN